MPTLAVDAPPTLAESDERDAHSGLGKPEFVKVVGASGCYLTHSLGRRSDHEARRLSQVRTNDRLSE